MVKTSTAVYPSPRSRVQAMKEYHPPLGNRDALRLDFNENTIACSPNGLRGAGANLCGPSHSLS